MEIIAYHGTDKTFDKFDKSYIYTDYAELVMDFTSLPMRLLHLIMVVIF